MPSYYRLQASETKIAKTTRQRWAVSVSAAAVIAVSTLVVVIVYYFSAHHSLSTASEIRLLHGIQPPASTHNVQTYKHRGFIDRSAVTLFEISESDLNLFKNSLIVLERTEANEENTFGMSSEPGAGASQQWDSVKRQLSMGNSGRPFIRPIDERFIKTWQGKAVPVELLECWSPTGDVLIVTIHSADATLLIEMRTDWN